MSCDHTTTTPGGIVWLCVRQPHPEEPDSHHMRSAEQFTQDTIRVAEALRKAPPRPKPDPWGSHAS